MRMNTCLPVVMYEPSLACLADRNLYLLWPESLLLLSAATGSPTKEATQLQAGLWNSECLFFPFVTRFETALSLSLTFYY